METAEVDRTETALADGAEGPRDLFGRGVRLVVSYIRMHPRPFAIAVIGPGKGRGMPLSACSPTFLTQEPNRPPVLRGLPCFHPTVGWRALAFSRPRRT